MRFHTHPTGLASIAKRQQAERLGGPFHILVYNISIEFSFIYIYPF